MLYAYLLLLFGGFAAFSGAPAWTIIPLAGLLALPAISKLDPARSFTAPAVMSIANALLFAVISYGIGRSVAAFLGA